MPYLFAAVLIVFVLAVVLIIILLVVLAVVLIIAAHHDSPLSRLSYPPKRRIFRLSDKRRITVCFLLRNFLTE